ncbi:unnamed protein product, partial [Iphiclides podalirius]
MFESLVSRLTSPPVSRRRHTVHAAREVCSEPEEEAPLPRRPRAAKQLLDKRRKARLSCADLTAAEPERASRIDALKAFLPLRQSKSLGRLDGLKESAYLSVLNKRVRGLLNATRSRNYFENRFAADTWRLLPASRLRHFVRGLGGPHLLPPANTADRPFI